MISGKDDRTLPASEGASLNATIGVSGQVDQAALQQAEQAVSLEWKPGDVILDLYEVRRVTEGFGGDAEEKDFHEGGFGRVYKVWHRSWRREMAVKTPRAGMFTTEEQQEAFTRECETWINLGLHPNTVSCHYVRSLGGVPRVFSEYAEAGTLEDWIRLGRLYEGDERSALARMLDAAIQFAWGLHYAHERGVIHQDVKPLNAVLWNDGTLKVTDFGLAGARQKAGIGGPAGDVSGGMQSILVSVGGMTPSFCSPEQAAGITLDRCTDVWSWAVSVLEMFQGEVTWQSGSLAGEALEAFLRHGGKEEGIPAMPEGVAALLRRCFRPDPADRPRTLQDCAKALGEVYETETGTPYPRTEPKAAEMDAESLNNRGLSLLDLGRVDEALAAWDEALARHPDHFETTYNRQVNLWQRGRITDQSAVEVIVEARKSRPEDWLAAYHLGLLHLARGDGESAKAVMSEAVSLGGGGELQGALQLAEVLLQLGGRCVRTFEGHTRPVESVCLSKDGRWALSASWDNTLRLWEVCSGRCVRTFEGHTKEVRSVSMSSDGRWAISGSNDGTLRFWELSSGRMFVGHTTTYSLCMSSDGRFALLGGWSTIRLIEISSGNCLKEFNSFSGYTVNSVCFSSDGRWALSGSADKTLCLWELSSGRCIRTFEGHTKGVTSVCLSSDGRWALSGSDDGTLRLWEVSSGCCVRMFEGHTDNVNSVCLSSDGRWALSGSQDTTLRLWEVSSGRCVRTFEGHADPVTCVCLSADGSWALSGSMDNNLRLWDVSSLTAGLSSQPLPMLLCRVRGVEEVLHTQARFADLITSAKQNLQAGRITEALSSLQQARAIPGFERNSEILDLNRQIGKRATIKSFTGGWLRQTLAGHTDSVRRICLSSDGRWVLSGGGDKELHLWEVSSGQCVRTFKGHTQSVISVCMSFDGCWALSGSRDNTLRLWEISSGRCVRTFEGHTLYVDSVFLCSDNTLALSGSTDKTLRLWDVSSGRCVQVFEGHTDRVHSACLNSDNRWALSGGADKTLRLWEISSGRCVRTFEGHTQSVIAVCLSLDNRWALSGSADGFLCLWDVSTGRLVRKFEGHTKGVSSVCLSPDGGWALSGSYDSTLRLWDVSSGHCVRSFEGHTDMVTSVCLSADCQLALSGSLDKTFRLWELDWEYEICS